jgi:hypothetical protein
MQDRVEIIMTEHKLLSMTPVSQFGQEFVDIKHYGLDNALLECGSQIQTWKKQYEAHYRLWSKQLVETSNRKFARLQTKLERSHYRNRVIEHEYCKIRFGKQTALRKRVGQLAKHLSNLQVAVIQGVIETLESTVMDLENNTQDLVDFVEEVYLRPRKSARANLDALLEYSERVGKEYKKLQTKGYAVRDGAAAIQKDLLLLAHSNIVDGPKLKRLAISLKANNFATSQVAHSHRSYWRGYRDWFEDPLRAADTHRPEMIFNSAGKILNTPWEISAAILLDKPLKRVIEKRHSLPVHSLQRLYRMWRQGPDPALCLPENRYLRQLDVMAPFYVLNYMHRRMVNEAWYLIGSLQGLYGPMWDGLSGHEATQYSDRIFDWATKYRENQKIFAEEVRMYQRINWLRLQTDDKLERLGLPSMQKQGIFTVPEPLSLDYARFDSYANTLASLYLDWWWVGVIVATSHKAVLNPTLSAERFWTRIAEILRQRAKIIKSPGIQNLGTDTAPKVALRRRRRRVITSASKAVERSHGNVTSRSPEPQPSRNGWKDQFKKTDRAETHSRQTQAQSEPRNVPVATAMSKLMAAFMPKEKTISKHKVAPTISFDANTPDNSQIAAFKGSMTDNEWSNPLKTSGSRSAITKPAWKKHQSPGDKPSATLTSKFTQVEMGINSKSKEKNKLAELEATVEKLRAQVAELQAKQEGSPIPSVAPPASLVARKTVGRRAFRNFARRGIRRSYCTESQFIHAGVQGCSHKSLPDQAATSHVPSITEATTTITTTTTTKVTIEPTEEGPSASQTSPSGLNREASEETTPLFWTHTNQRAPNGQKLIVHYCRTLDSTEEVSKLFLDSKVIGFDMEWKAQAFATDSIQNNLSLIQIANEERIALFQIAMFKPARGLEDFVAPSLRRILECPNITKVGVAIKADSTRLRKFLGIEARSILELSHLFKLVKFGQANPKLVNKRSVNLSEQMEEHFGLPLDKSEDLRCGDWTRSLNYRQVQC